MNKTGIKWTDKTWNPVTGCQKVSEGCKYCYASTLAERFSGGKAYPNGFAMTLHPERLNQPKNLVKSQRIFVNSMSDVFWSAIPRSFVDQMFDVMEATPHLTYQILTKRPEAMLSYSRRRRFTKNIWVGVTVESQAVADRLDVLREVQTDGYRFVSAEPLLSPLAVDWSGLDWVITGGESGEHLMDATIRQSRALVTLANCRWTPRIDRIPWIRAIRDASKASKLAFFHKQWGGVINNIAGNELDGRIWEEYPYDAMARM
ncbi:phage Gp37/Gp68 family protein [Termitidicoccus mucosus]|uniref:Uncharacterized protein n=1 Tax=Termitidicoccus mucosus TaxID=1184151 RepID=A0A178IG20_9BACT|nr:hypothetical protein AW736_09285 [Opitutaceae bacterium TSB47]